jgi:putative zinc finger protein
MRKGGEEREDMNELEDMRQAFAAAAGPPPAPERCPAPETIWAAAQGELPPAEAREVVDHTAGCPACAEDWRLALALVEGAPAVERAPAPVSPVLTFPPRRRFYAPIAALAAAACLLIAVGVQQRMHGPQPTYREEDRENLRSLVADVSLPRDHFRLCWTPKKDATYDLLVSTEQLRQVTRKRGLTSHCYTVSPAALAGLPPGARLVWQVDATWPDGRSLSSDTFMATLE